MKKIGLVAALAASAVVVPSAAAAQVLHQGDYDTRSIDQYTATYDIHADGSTDVTIDFLFNFNGEPGHGPYLSYPTRLPYDDTTDRLYPISDVRASSPTGAPAKVYLEELDGWLEIRIGDEDIDDVTGAQEYVLTYTLEGALDETLASDLDPSIAPADDKAVFDEFYWDVIGDGWAIPLDDITIIVKGDAGATDVRCFAGEYGSTDGCTTSALTDGVATFTQAHLDPYNGMTVAVAFPPRSFNTTPIVEPAADSSVPTAASPGASPSAATGASGNLPAEDGSRSSVATYVAIGAGFLSIAAIGVLLGAGGRRRKAADGPYPGLAPGFSPDDAPKGGQGDGLL